MILRCLIAGALALAFVMPAQARHARHHRHRSHFVVGAPVHCDDRYQHTCDVRGWREGRRHPAQVAAPIHERPRDCYGIAWCGCWLRHQFGLADRGLNLAINWARMGSPATPETANVAVWRHHVGRVLDHRAGMILLQSGNDGGAVRTRWRSTRGVVAWRKV